MGTCKQRRRALLRGVALAVATTASALVAITVPASPADAALPAAYYRFTSSQTPLAPNARTDVIGVGVPAGRWLVRLSATAVNLGSNTHVLCHLVGTDDPPSTVFAASRTNTDPGGGTPAANIFAVGVASKIAPGPISVQCYSDASDAYLDPGTSITAMAVDTSATSESAVLQDGVVAQKTAPAGPAVLEMNPSLYYDASDDQDYGRCSLSAGGTNLASSASTVRFDRSQQLSLIGYASPGATTNYQVQCSQDRPGPGTHLEEGRLVYHKPPTGTKQARRTTPMLLSTTQTTYVTVTQVALTAGKWILAGTVTLSHDRSGRNDFYRCVLRKGTVDPRLQRDLPRRLGPKHDAGRHGHPRRGRDDHHGLRRRHHRLHCHRFRGDDPRREGRKHRLNQVRRSPPKLGVAVRK